MRRPFVLAGDAHALIDQLVDSALADPQPPARQAYCGEAALVDVRPQRLRMDTQPRGRRGCRQERVRGNRCGTNVPGTLSARAIRCVQWQSLLREVPKLSPPVAKQDRAELRAFSRRFILPHLFTQRTDSPSRPRHSVVSTTRRIRCFHLRKLRH